MRIVRVTTQDRHRDLFAAWAEVYAVAGRHALGEGHAPWTAVELRELARHPDRRRLAWVALTADGEVVGAAGLILPMLDNLAVAVLSLAVHPAHRRRGVGTLLLRESEQAAAEEGRTVLMAETEWLPERDDECGEGFARRYGYAAAQTVVRSSLALPADRARLEGVLAGDGADGYAIRTMVDGIPDSWLEGRAELSRRMSTDAPLGDLRLEEEHWDAERVRADYARIEALGRTVIDSFAVHRARGRLVGYSQVQVPRERPEVAFQQDTLVVGEHRGHHLGLRLKAAATLALMDRAPDVRAVRTWNADDNLHMLAVNHELGYARDALVREWQKVTG